MDILFYIFQFFREVFSFKYFRDVAKYKNSNEKPKWYIILLEILIVCILVYSALLILSMIKDV